MNKKYTIIGLFGKKRSGKGTIANHLVEKHKFKEFSWAEPLKQHIGRDLFGLTDKQMNGTEEEKEAVIPEWGLSGRQILQMVGTEWFRNFDPDFWVKTGVRKVKEYNKEHRIIFEKDAKIVFSDCRFPNEIEAIKKMGGLVVKIIRGYPKGKEPEKDNHASEIALDNYKADNIILADSGDLDTLRNGIDDLLKEYY